MKKILTLYGVGSCGKTTTITKFYKKICAEGGKTICKKEAQKDSWWIVRYKDKIIGVTTRGDDGYTLKKDFENFADCDLCVCASRTKGSSIDFLKQFELYLLAKEAFCPHEKETHYNFAFIEKIRDASNDCQAQKMLEIVNALL